ncbi:MAG: ATP-grasp domain-containing protein, partial [Terriglobia bacterium]
KMPDLRDEQAVVAGLLHVGRRFGLKGWVLYPTRDETVAALSRHRNLLAEYFRVPTPQWDTIQWVWDKRNTYRRAKELGIAVPRTECPGDAGRLRTLDISFPVAIKPAIKEHFLRATKAKAWRANNHAELESLFQRAANLIGPDEVMVQELVPGDGRHQFAYCAFFKEHHAVGRMIARRTRQHPVEFGRASTYVETTEEPLLETVSERFLRSIDYYGLVELEYKLDPRDRQYKLLDVNARTWGYHTLGRRAGVDFPWLLFADQLGHHVEPQRAQCGVSWVRLVTDLPAAACQILAGRLKCKAYLRSLRAAQIESVFSREDPIPAIAELALIPYLAARRGF